MINAECDQRHEKWILLVLLLWSLSDEISGLAPRGPNSDRFIPKTQEKWENDWNGHGNLIED